MRCVDAKRPFLGTVGIRRLRKAKTLGSNARRSCDADGAGQTHPARNTKRAAARCLGTLNKAPGGGCVVPGVDQQGQSVKNTS